MTQTSPSRKCIDKIKEFIISAYYFLPFILGISILIYAFTKKWHKRIHLLDNDEMYYYLAIYIIIIISRVGKLYRDKENSIERKFIFIGQDLVFASLGLVYSFSNTPWGSLLMWVYIIIIVAIINFESISQTSEEFKLFFHGSLFVFIFSLTFYAVGILKYENKASKSSSTFLVIIPYVDNSLNANFGNNQNILKRKFMYSTTIENNSLDEVKNLAIKNFNNENIKPVIPRNVNKGEKGIEPDFNNLVIVPKIH
jgi:hypothetical protein